MAQDEMDSGTNVIYASGSDRASTTAAHVITIEKIAEIVAKLKADNVPTFNGYYVCVLHPHIGYDLKTAVGTNDWLPVNAYTSNVDKIFRGELGAMFGCRFVESSNVQFYTDAGDSNVDVYPTFVFGDRSFHQGNDGTVQTFYKPLGSGDDELNQRANVGTKLRTGFKIGRNEGVYRVESASSIGAN